MYIYVYIFICISVTLPPRPCQRVVAEEDELSQPTQQFEDAASNLWGGGGWVGGRKRSVNQRSPPPHPQIWSDNGRSVTGRMEGVSANGNVAYSSGGGGAGGGGGGGGGGNLTQVQKERIEEKRSAFRT